MKTELPLESVGHHDAHFTFACLWAPVSDPSFSRRTSSPARFGLLRTVSRYHADRDGSSDNHRHNLTQAKASRAAQSASILLSDSVNAATEARHKIHIQNPAEQTNRPVVAVVADKGLPQSDSFSKYAAPFLECLSHQ